MMRRLAASVLALALVLPVAAAAAEMPYGHEWRIEGLYVGDAGTTRRAVVDDRMTLSFADGVWTGSVRLLDTLAIQEASGVTQSQAASITLQLEGDPTEGGTGAAGRFTGVAELRTREAPSVEDALRTTRGGTLAVYDVSGFWAARLEGDVAEGQLVYQSARRRAGADGPTRDADWFNRAPDEGLDATGQPQPFTVAVRGVDPSAGGPEGLPSEEPQKNPARPGFFDYVGRGIRGQSTARPITVSALQAAAARALREARPSGATPLPDNALGIDSDLSGGYLDAKNRAAGLLGADMVPTGATADRGSAEVKALFESTPGRRAPDENVDVATYYKNQLANLLEGAGDLSGQELLLGDLADVPAGADAETVTRLRVLLAAAESLVGPFPSRGAVVAAASAAADRVADSAVPRQGPLASAVLAAADDPATPVSAREVARFDRASSLDVSATVAGTTLPSRVLATAGSGEPPTALAWGGGASSVQPESWLAYRRSDGAVFWLAGPDGPVALADATLTGWAWRHPRAVLVDPAHVGRVYVRYVLP